MNIPPPSKCESVKSIKDRDVRIEHIRNSRPESDSGIVMHGTYRMNGDAELRRVLVQLALLLWLINVGL
jgi:transposase